MSVANYAAEERRKLEISEISENIYLHKSFKHVPLWGLIGSNGLVYIEGKKAFIIDTPWSEDDTEKLVTWTKDQGVSLAGSISTHSHDDRTAGIAWLNAKGIPTYAYKLTNNFLKQGGYEMATHTLTEDENKLFGGNLIVYYPGGGHTQDNVVVWLPKSKVLFGGCFVRSLNSRNLGYIKEANIDKWPKSMNKVLSRYPDVKTVVPGHGKYGDIRLLMHTKKLSESQLNKSIHTENARKNQ